MSVIQNKLNNKNNENDLLKIIKERNELRNEVKRISAKLKQDNNIKSNKTINKSISEIEQSRAINSKSLERINSKLNINGDQNQLKLQNKRQEEKIETLIAENEKLKLQFDSVKNNEFTALNTKNIPTAVKTLLSQASFIIEWLKSNRIELFSDLSSEQFLQSYDLSPIQTAVERLTLALDISEREERKNIENWKLKQREQKNRQMEIAKFSQPSNVFKNEPQVINNPSGENLDNININIQHAADQLNDISNDKNYKKDQSQKKLSQNKQVNPDELNVKQNQNSKIESNLNNKNIEHNKTNKLDDYYLYPDKNNDLKFILNERVDQLSYQGFDTCINWIQSNFCRPENKNMQQICPPEILSRESRLNSSPIKEIIDKEIIIFPVPCNHVNGQPKLQILLILLCPYLLLKKYENLKSNKSPKILVQDTNTCGVVHSEIAQALNKVRMILDQSIGNEILRDEAQRVSEFNLPVSKLDGPVDARGNMSAWQNLMMGKMLFEDGLVTEAELKGIGKGSYLESAVMNMKQKVIRKCF